MYLIDTSVWIDFLRGNASEAVEKLKQLLRDRVPVGITSAIYQELLQGAESEAHFEKFRDYFGSQRFYHPLDPVVSYCEAARIYFACRRRGITVRSTIDCLIARIAIEQDLALLQSDRDFPGIAQAVPELRLA